MFNHRVRKLSTNTFFCQETVKKLPTASRHWLSPEQQPYFWKRFRGDAVHALLVTHRTATPQQDSRKLNSSRMKMKVMKKSSGVKLNGSMEYRQEGTYWSGQGAQRLFSARWSLCVKNTERRKKNNNNKKYKKRANNQQRDLRYERMSKRMAL